MIKELLQKIKTEAALALTKLVFPDPRQEDWRYIDLSPVKEIPWQIADDRLPFDYQPLTEADYQLVFHNNIWQADRSILGEGELVVLGSVLSEKLGDLLGAHFNRYIDAQDVITQINSSHCRDLSIIYAPPHQTGVISVDYFNQGHHWANHPRCLIVLAPHSRLTIVEVHRGSKDTYWSNPVVEVHLGEQSHLTHIILQDQGLAAFHTQTTRVSQEKSSFYHLQTIDLGAFLSRHNVHIEHRGEFSSTTLQGLVTIGGNQTADTHSTILHSYPEGRSTQLHKCILQDRSHGVFNGRICVPKRGQMTDASQTSRNLLLSPHARIDTKPQLEIGADNVKCSHGATVSQLDREEQFYLQSRGIDQAAATKLLTYGFAGEIIEHIPMPSVRQFVQRAVRG